MKALYKPGYEKNRIRLADKLPLTTPFTLYITPSQICNFRCNYCTQSWDAQAKKQIGLDIKLLDDEVFSKLINQAAAFPEPFKQVLFTGLGEPLLNDRTPDMIAELRNRGIAEKIDLYTNGTMLTQDMTHRLVDAGITRLRISIQGLSSEQYKQVTGADVDFNQLISQIKYFYDNRKDSLLYIKIIDSCLQDEKEKEEFYKIFGSICDEIFIEHLVLSQPTMGDYDGKIDESLTLYGEKMVDKDVCPLLFYVLQTDASGNVFPCTPLGLPTSFSLGNIKETTLWEIWNGLKLKNLRVTQLKKRRVDIPLCASCQNFLCVTHDTDNLDDDTEAILRRL